MEIAGYVVIFLGILLFWISALGLLRMPDLLTRIHAGTKATTLASLLVILGAILIRPEWSLKLVALGVFITITNPLSSSVLARAGHRLAQKERDEAEEPKEQP